MVRKTGITKFSLLVFKELNSLEKSNLDTESAYNTTFIGLSLTFLHFFKKSNFEKVNLRVRKIMALIKLKR
jgi:hypothetical protein